MSRKYLSLCCIYLCLFSIFASFAAQAVPEAAVILPSEISEWVKQGNVYFYGDASTKKNYKKAYEYFEKAADKGHPEALYMLATLIYEGKGTRKDEKEAYRLYEVAAEKGQTDSQMITGMQYLYLAIQAPAGSVKSNKDYATAAKWLKLAADKGQSEAMLWYGNMQINGLGNVKKDSAAGLKWVEKAAAQHNPNAHAVLGGYYMEGKNAVPQNFKKAYKHFLLSVSEGNKNALFALSMLKDKLTKEQRQQAAQEAKDWQKANPRSADSPKKKPLF